jgi:lipoate-protein ligase A
VDFDYEMMSRVLNVPDEKFRDKVHKTIRENLSTIRREIGDVPPRDALWSLMAEKFIEMLGPMEIDTTVDEAWRAETDELAERFLSDAWLYQKRRPTAERDVRIRAGVNVIHKMHKAPGGLIRAVVEVREGRLAGVSLSGDFFLYPEERLFDLERALADILIEDVEAVVTQFYAEHDIESPGVTPQDFAQVLTP